MDANRGSSRRDPDHPGSPSSLSAVAQCTPGGTEAQSVSRFEAGAQAAAFFEGGPTDVEDHEVRGCVEGVGAGTVGSPHVFGGSSQEGQDGGFNRVSRHHQSPTRGVSCRSECENGSSPGFSGSVGSRRHCGKSCSRGCVGEGPCTSHSCTSWATFRRVREVLRAGGEASREGSGSSGRSVEGADAERGRVGGGEASVGSSPNRSWSPTCSAANYPRDRRG